MPRAEPAKRTQTLPGIPSVPRLPGELAPTLPVPNPLQRQTIRRPTPPSAVAAARRTDPPVAPEPSLTNIRLPNDARPSSAPPGASLPPPSQNPDRARISAQERELDKLRAEKAQLERDARAAAEAKVLTYPPRVEDRRPSPQPTPSSVPPDGSVESLRKALTKLVLGVAAVLALLGTPLALWVSNVAAEAKARAERATTQVAQASNDAESAKTKTGTNAKDQATLEKEFRQFRANSRELSRLQGVVIPKHEGDPEPQDLKPYAPLCPAGRVCPGPQLIITVPP